MNQDLFRKAYDGSREIYAGYGVDTEAVLERLSAIPISMQCWQGDDVTGFEKVGKLSDGGLMATGDYPGKPRNADELRMDMEEAFSLIPGRHRINLHALYAEPDSKVERNELEPEHFSRWIDWTKEQGVGLDFNPSFFAHPMVRDGFTLTSADEDVRRFWIEHGISCRRIGASMGKELGNPCITNFWIPDGYKDSPADRKGPRMRLTRSLDEIFSEEIDPEYNRDSLESKLFGIGSESYIAGSHEFYLGYAIRNQKLLCLDSGHFHPTEDISDKISAILVHLDEILLHISRGVRWDSDHVVILTEEPMAIAREIVRGDFMSRVHIGLDYFDATINRVAAWVIGMRSMIKALLIALLEPSGLLRDLEAEGDLTARLALMEELKTLPFGSVWDHYCLRNDVPTGRTWLEEIKLYERDVLSRRD